MLSKEEIKKIEQARSNIFRGIDIESAAFILEKVILDNCVEIGGRVNTLRIATRQILYFIENSKIKNVGDKHILDYVRENVSLGEQVKQLKEDKQKIIEKLEEKIEMLEDVSDLCKIDGKIAKYKIENLQEEIEEFKEILEIVKGEKNE